MGMSVRIAPETAEPAPSPGGVDGTPGRSEWLAAITFNSDTGEERLQAQYDALSLLPSPPRIGLLPADQSARALARRFAARHRIAYILAGAVASPLTLHRLQRKLLPEERRLLVVSADHPLTARSVGTFLTRHVA